MNTQRRDSGHNVTGIVDTYTIDFANKSNLQKKIISSYLGQSLVSVHISQVNCVGIAGNWVIKQDVSNSGTTAVDLPEGTQTITSAVTGEGALTKGTLTMEHLVVELPATLPATGKAVVTITAKRG